MRVAVRGRAVKRRFVVRVHVFTDATRVLAVVALYFIEPAIPAGVGRPGNTSCARRRPGVCLGGPMAMTMSLAR